MPVAPGARCGMTPSRQSCAVLDTHFHTSAPQGCVRGEAFLPALPGQHLCGGQALRPHTAAPAGGQRRHWDSDAAVTSCPRRLSQVSPGCCASSAEQTEQGVDLPGWSTLSGCWQSRGSLGQPDPRGSVSASETSARCKTPRGSSTGQAGNLSKWDGRSTGLLRCEETEGLEHVRERNPALQSRDGRKCREEQRSSELSAK